MGNFKQEIKNIENEITDLDLERPRKEKQLKSIFKDRKKKQKGKISTQAVDIFGTSIVEGVFVKATVR